jgi:ammonia channel protein AmtB
VGIVVTIAIAGVPTALIALILKRANALRVTEAQELVGLDQTLWGTDAYEPVTQHVAVPASPQEVPLSAEVPPESTL